MYLPRNPEFAADAGLKCSTRPGQCQEDWQVESVMEPTSPFEWIS
jgi:hypothetical protein